MNEELPKQEPKVESGSESLKEKVSKLKGALKVLEIEIGNELNRQPNWTEVNQILRDLEVEAESK